MMYRPWLGPLLALVVLVVCCAASLEVNISEEQINELLSRPAYTDDMRHTIRQRIREGRFRPDWAAEVNTEEEEEPVEEEQEEGAEETEAHPRGKRGLGFRGPARAAEVHHNVERVLSAQLVNATILNYIMVANRTVQLHEDMINRALGAWVALWRMSDTGEMYYNRVIGLNNMAYNLSTSAAQTFDDFASIPWVGRFRDELVCNLNFRQPDQDDSTTADFAFAFPDYCVQSVASTNFTGDTLSELHQAMLGDNEDLLLNNDYNQISLSCATPDAGVSGTYKWYCWMYFVQLSASIDSDTCLCAADSCCPTNLGL